MDNLNRPASPQPIAFCEGNSTPQTACGIHDDFAGFTKLELASLMIAQGMLANSVDCNQGVEPWWVGGFSKISKDSVLLAKAIIEEANK